jgi:hypothetical protein
MHLKYFKANKCKENRLKVSFEFIFLDAFMIKFWNNVAPFQRI